MNPTNIFGSSPQPENGSFVSFEEMENAFKTPTQRQADYEPKPEPDPSSDDLGHLADPMGDAFHDFQQIEDEPAPDTENPEKAQRTGERIARLVDTGIDFALSNFVAHNNESYRADERDLQDIAECWGEVAQEKGWSIGPEWSLIILYIMVYGPLVKQAITDRRLAAIEAQQAAMQLQQEAMQQQLDQMQADQQSNTKPLTPATDGNDKPNPTPSPFNYKPAN